MGLRPADGVGVSVGQPDRIDYNSEAHLRRLQAGASLDVSSTLRSRLGELSTPAAPRPPPERAQDPRGRGAERDVRGGWTRQDDAARDRGRAWQSGQLATWQAFTRGRGRSDATDGRGAVVIDASAGGSRRAAAVAPRAPSVPGASPGAAPEPGQAGWRRMQLAHHRAARFEEYGREALTPFLGKKPDRIRRGFLRDD